MSQKQKESIKLLKKASAKNTIKNLRQHHNSSGDTCADPSVDPFSFAQSVKETINFQSRQKKRGPAEVVDSFLKSHLMDDTRGSFNNFVNVTSNSVSNTIALSNAANSFIEGFLSKFSFMVSKTVEQNIHLGEDLLKCKDAKDMISFQKKMFEANSSNVINFCLDVGANTQALMARNLDLFSQSISQSFQGFTQKG